MSLSIPAVVNEYFNASNRHDVDAVVRCFTADAVVRDDGKTHAGQAAIGQWIAASNQEYNAIATAVAASSEGDTAIVDCQVSGDFAGGPVDLRFAFGLTKGGIATLEITA